MDANRKSKEQGEDDAMKTGPLDHLRQLKQGAWDRLVAELSPEIHPVDRDAVAIWFSFWPLKLWDALESVENLEELERDWRLTGDYRLSEQLDRSVDFLYGSRWWPQVKEAVLESLEKAGESSELRELVRSTVERLASSLKVTPDLLTGVTTLAWAALCQVGAERFAQVSGASVGRRRSSPAKIVQRRQQSGQGILGFLRGADRRHRVVFDERRRQGFFQAREGQDLSMASRSDSRDYQSKDPRRLEGPIPFECRSASCGFCWIGILGGRDRLGKQGAHERKRLRFFGYLSPDGVEESHPLIRLACQSQCYGDVTAVIPPWNGMLEGRL